MMLAALTLFGCGRSEPESTAPARPQAGAAPLAAIDRASLDQLVAKHRGDVVLVDFWATWCLPCVAIFPHTVSLQRSLADRGLRVVTISLDSPKDAKTVTEFLNRQGAMGADNYLASNGGTSQGFEEFEIPGGALPHLKIYDRRGKLRETITGTHAKTVEKKIDGVMKMLLDEK